MADYKELLRRAISVLPENNGAARRAVYEKARTALVGQLRAIDPPLPAREITQHRLQLEDCIRQVEREASEAVIADLKNQEEAPAPRARMPEPVVAPVVAEPPPPPQVVEAAAEPEPQPGPADEPEPPFEREPETVPEAPVAEEPEVVEAASEPTPEAEPPLSEVDQIQALIAEADRAQAEPVEATPEPVVEIAPDVGEPTIEPPQAEEPRPVPSIIARAEAGKSGPSTPLVFSNPSVKTYNAPLKGPTFEPRREAVNLASAQRVEPSLHSQAVARQHVAEPLAAIEQQGAVALSTVREVEVEPGVIETPANDPQVAIDRAIATLDREARGETPAAGTAASNVVEVNPGAANATKPAKPSIALASDEDEEFEPGPLERGRGGNAITIFLAVFALLLLAAGGAGYWAWREGYIDPAAMFGQNVAATDATVPEPNPAVQPTAADGTESATGPGNTVATAQTTEPTQELKPDDRLPSAEAAAPAVVSPPVEVNTPTAEDKSNERLPSSDPAAAPQVANADATAAATANLAGNQSLLLEASDDGTTGAVPFSGTVEWTKGKDEVGQPTLVGKAKIPARNLTVDVLIRRNADPSLPASHLMEVNFDVSQTFIGGSIAGLPGVLLKNEELVQGTPLIGASARVVGNSFLFALSASPTDSTTNTNLLTSRKWMDLAIIYATGKRAIITLEKDEDAAKLFDDVFAEWAKAPPLAEN